MYLQVVPLKGPRSGKKKKKAANVYSLDNVLAIQWLLETTEVSTENDGIPKL